VSATDFKLRTIYALHDPRIEDQFQSIFYVGQTSNFHARANQHLIAGVTACRYDTVEPVYRRYRAIIEAGYVPKMHPMGTSVKPLADVLVQERQIIEWLWDQGIVVLNFPNDRKKRGLIVPEDIAEANIA
jgi:hypothetical protein